MRTVEEQIFNSMIQQGAFARYLCGCFYYAKRMNSVKNSIKSNRKNQAVIEEQAKAFGSLAKDVSDIKQKIMGNGDDK